MIVTWIDLANAYGSVMHNLIQFALSWYHVPLSVRRIIHCYYDKLVAKVVTKDWQTQFFHYDIGLFQGCTMSTILFDITFNLLLDFIKCHDNLGYAMKRPLSTKGMRKAYADDLTIITGRLIHNQQVLNAVLSGSNGREQ